jgi:uncharacterized protein
MTQALNVTREPTMEEILASIRRIIEDGNPPLPEDSVKKSFAADESEEVLEFRREFGEEAIADSLQHAGAMTALGQKIGAKNAAPIIEAAFHRSEPQVTAPRAEMPEVLAKPVEEKEDELTASVETSGRTEESSDKMEALERVQAFDRTDVLPEDFAPAAEIAAPVIEAEPQPAPPESHLERHLRPILSDMTGRQVAAAFSDLTSAIEKERQQSLAEIAEDMIRPMLQEWLDNNLPTMVERLVREEIERVSRSGRR